MQVTEHASYKYLLKLNLAPGKLKN